MSFSLSLKNIRKSFKDYAIYFLTLIFGVAIFYIFNSMDSQKAIIEISGTKMQWIELLNTMLGYISIFISVILGFLIVYANNFLIKRRKKEFGVYMTLGMGKRKISKLLLVETILIGIISLGVGLVIGVIGSQFMSVLVAKMFEVDMSQYTFVFSNAALLKTVLYFGIIYLFVMLFNTFAISKCKLIDLLNAQKKNEKVKIKNPIFSIILFMASLGCLGTAYYFVFSNQLLNSLPLFGIVVLLGVIGTILFFASLAGFILRIVQTSKRLYLKNLNCFVLRQINSKINTTTVAVSLICIMLFLTICIFSSSFSLNQMMKKDLVEQTPVDASIWKNRNVKDHGKYKYTSKEIEDSHISNIETLEKLGINTTQLYKEAVEVNLYAVDEFTIESFHSPIIQELKKDYPLLAYESNEPIMKVSDYNKVATLFGKELLQLEEDEFIEICDYDQSKVLRDRALKAGTIIEINGKKYHSKTTECVPGFIQISPSALNSGITIVPDDALLREDQIAKSMLNVKYNANSKEEYEKVEKYLADLDSDTTQRGIILINATTKNLIYDSSTGLSAIVTFIGLYLGIIFLITSAAILALKELSDSSDNKQRYAILRKIGTDEKMIHHSLFTQIGIFFMMPLLLAIVHSIVGMKFANSVLAIFGKTDILPAIIMTAISLIVIYGGYFIATYLCSKAIIKEDNN